MKSINLPLNELAEGAIQEKLDIELQKVFKNIHDPNTEATSKRTITIKLDFKPDDNRQTVVVLSEFKTKLADVTGVATTVLTGHNLDTGQIEAAELKSSIPGQTYFDENSQLKTDTGEPIEDTERKVIDLQKGANK